jgi:hypothetical protein
MAAPWRTPTLIKRRSARDAACEVTIHLLSVDQLFAPPPPERVHEAGSLLAGIDQLVNELSHRSLRGRVRATILLPKGEIRPGLEQWIHSAITRYCQLRARDNNNELRAIKKEGVRALTEGGVVAAVCLLLSTLLLTSDAPEAVRVFLGEGILLVIAWVALWYPLDTLIIGRRPFRRQQITLDALQDMEIVVRPA